MAPAAHRRFTEWSAARGRAKPHRLVLDALGARGEPDRSRRAIASGTMRARKKGGLTGPDPVDRGRKGSKIHSIAERTGLPRSIGISGAHLHGSRALEPLVRGVPPVRSRRGPPAGPPGCTATGAATTTTCAAGAASATASPAGASSPPAGRAGTAGPSNGPGNADVPHHLGELRRVAALSAGDHDGQDVPRGVGSETEPGRQAACERPSARSSGSATRPSGADEPARPARQAPGPVLQEAPWAGPSAAAQGTSPFRAGAPPAAGDGARGEGVSVRCQCSGARGSGVRARSRISSMRCPRTR
jgi:hypothetical protein